MDYRPPRNCLAQFLPANELHSREIRKVGDWPTGFQYGEAGF
jgi:hypothetical protein